MATKHDWKQRNFARDLEELKEIAIQLEDVALWGKNTTDAEKDEVVSIVKRLTSLTHIVEERIKQQ